MNRLFKGALEYRPESGETFNLDALRAIVRDTAGMPGDHQVWGLGEEGMEQLSGLVLKHDTQSTVEVTTRPEPDLWNHFDPNFIYPYRHVDFAVELVTPNPFVQSERLRGLEDPRSAAERAVRKYFHLADDVEVMVSEVRS